MEDLFNVIVQTSIYASIVGIIIILFKVLLKNKISPWWNYIIWFVFILKLLIPFGPESSISLFNFIPKATQSSSFIQPAFNVQKPVPIEKPVVTNYSAPSNLLPDKAENIQSNIPLIPIIWLVGVLLMFMWVIYTNYLLHKRLKNCNFTESNTIKSIFEECKNKTNVKKDIKLITQEIITTPSLFGVVKPKILLSPDIINLSNSDISYILLHELSHYKRKDLAVNYLLLFLQAMHWFNPIIWYCFRKIRQDMEVATDAKVLTLLNSSQQKEYGKAILTLLETFSSQKLTPKLIGMIDDKTNIKRRIVMIKMNDFFRGKRNIIAAVSIALITFLSGILLTNGISAEATANSAKSSIKPNAANSINFFNLANIEKNTIANINDVSDISILSSDKNAPINIDIRDKKTISYFINGLNNLKLIAYKTPITPTQPKGGIYISLTYNKNASEYFCYIDGQTGNFAPNYSPIMSSLPKFTHHFEDVKALNTLIKSVNHNTTDIETAISNAIKSQGKYYGPGEIGTEGHVTLSVSNLKEKTIAYTMASYAAFGFENGIFTMVSGSSNIPTAITFSKNNHGEYTLVKLEEPQDGEGYMASAKKLFPQKLWSKILDPSSYSKYNLSTLEEKEAKEYLKSIGRNAKVSISYVNKKLAKINDAASNKLFFEYPKSNSKLANFPYWLGTREFPENGVRYIYETSQGKTSDGYDMICLTKKKLDGTVVETYKYKIVGSEPKLMK